VDSDFCDFPVLAKEADSELFACPVMARKAISEPLVCPVTVKETVIELPACPVTAKRAAPELSSGPEPTTEVIHELVSCVNLAAEGICGLYDFSVAVKETGHVLSVFSSALVVFSSICSTLGFPPCPCAPLSHPPLCTLLLALAPGQMTNESLAPRRSSALSLLLVMACQSQQALTLRLRRAQADAKFSGVMLG
ncbi:hypothetical protein M9458_036638, partial [Cirrhinus mrigala]